MNRHDCYEACLQSPSETVRLLLALHGSQPTGLAEDFCGTAAVSRCWVDRVAGGRAIAVDADRPTVAEAERRTSATSAIDFRACDVLDCGEPCDALYVGNFSIGEFHDPTELSHYLEHARFRLRTGGVFLCDIYGGSSAFEIGSVHRLHRFEHPEFGPVQIRYTWEQREADSGAAIVRNACHFRVQRAGQIVAEFDDAFVYHWRLWSIAELKRAMRDAGFARVEIYGKDADPDHPQPAAAIDESFAVWIAAWR